MYFLFVKFLLLFFLTSIFCFGSTLYFKDGNSVEAKILDANDTHVRIAKDKDLQQFRFKIEALTIDSQKQIELYHSKDRYSSIPSSKIPLDKRILNSYVAYIDELIDQNLRSKRLQKTKPLDDYSYARRLYLTVVGRIPTQDELLSFINDRDSSKKDKLIQKLLNSSGYTNHQINWWSDMLRVKDRINGSNINVGSVYRKWLRNSIESKKPYDQMVRELVGSSGKLLDGGEAISYYLRDRGMQEDNLSHTIRIFLGTRLECAMCHNHPFDKWSQRQFYEMTAFTSGIGNVRLRDQGKAIGSLSRAINEDGDVNAGLFNNWRNIVRDSIQSGIENNGTGTIKLPIDFAEDDGKPGDTIFAKAIFTPKPTKVIEGNSRKVFADWLASKDNPRFTTMIANRVWKRIFGAGLIEPIDTMMDDTVASNQKLMKYLERLLVSVNYDLREYERILLNTKLFQRSAKKQDYKSLEEYNFEGPILRRMTGEQLWDSLVTLVYNNIDSAERVYLYNQQDYSVIYHRYKDMTGEQIYADFKKLAQENDGNRNLLAILSTYQTNNKNFKDKSLVRSSYLPYPAPGGHLIRQFGGSDKEQIDNSNAEPNTTQVLNLLNGFVESNILNKKDADFIIKMQSEKSKQKQVENAFLSILSRKPMSNESTLLKKYVDEKNGFKHVSWILLNAHEFIFIK
mgnify:CR=1 FL=1|tara:strand:- start:8117 stop:10159 length:2043 start_codon:yes stop_codon:yes gene_type:complete